MQVHWKKWLDMLLMTMKMLLSDGSDKESSKNYISGWFLREQPWECIFWGSNFEVVKC